MRPPTMRAPSGGRGSYKGMRAPHGRVVTRGSPDMREPKGFSSHRMPQTDYQPYGNPYITEGLKQTTVMDNIKSQGTIFDELRMRHDPREKMRYGIPIEYVPPGEEYMSRASRRHKQPKRIMSAHAEHLLQGPDISGRASPHIKGGVTFFEGKPTKLKETPKGFQLTDKGSQSLTQRLKGERPEVEIQQMQRVPLGKLKSSKSKKEQIKEYLSSLKGKPSKESEPYKPLSPPTTELPEEEVSNEQVGVNISEPKRKSTSKSFRYPYNKQVVSDIQKFKHGKASWRRKGTSLSKSEMNQLLHSINKKHKKK